MTRRRDGEATERSADEGGEDLIDALARDSKELWLPPARRGAAASEQLEQAERRLFDRISSYDEAARTSVVVRRDASFWRPVALLAAVAAVVVFVARPHGDGSGTEATRAPLPSETAPAAGVVSPDPARPTAPAELARVSPGGELRVNGAPVAGARPALRDGDALEARGGVAAFAAPGRVAWLLENGTEVNVARSGGHGGAIILSLRVGAVEAQVTPVPAGEAFAVDVDGVRVAVHGTHLRVARAERDGGRVVVDLSEGVISVGAPPKAGATVGLLVTAPAHVEFSVADLDGTLRVDHDAAHVRAAVDPASAESATPPVHPTSTPLFPVETSAPPGPAILGARPPSTPAPRPVDPTDAIVAAVRTCSEQLLPGGTGALTVRSVLTVEVQADGAPGLASFDPPLVPELQRCIGKAVYATRWSEPGQQHIPIELHR